MSPLLPGETLGQGHRGFRQRVFKWVASFWFAVTNPACCEEKKKKKKITRRCWIQVTSRGCERSREGHQCAAFHQSPIYHRVNEQTLQSDYQYGNGVHWVSDCCKMNCILLCWTALHNCVCLFVFHHISFITLRSKNKHEKEINFAAALQRALIYNRWHCTVCKYRAPLGRRARI